MNNEKHPVSTEDNGQADALAWKAMVVKYQKPSTWRALWQIVNTLGPYALLWYLMYRSVTVSWSIALAILAGGFLVRIFIIHHDCGHGSFTGAGNMPPIMRPPVIWIGGAWATSGR